MLFVCQLCGSEHSSSGALRVHKSKVHRRQKASPPPLAGKITSYDFSVEKEEAPRHKELPRILFVENVGERRSRNWELEDPVMRAGIADLKRLIYINKILRIKKAIEEEKMKLKSFTA